MLFINILKMLRSSNVSVTINAVVDSVYDDGYARISLLEGSNEEQVEINSTFLPRNVKEGDNLRIVMSVIPPNGHDRYEDTGGFIPHEPRWRD